MDDNAFAKDAKGGEIRPSLTEQYDWQTEPPRIPHNTRCCPKHLSLPSLAVLLHKTPLCPHVQNAASSYMGEDGCLYWDTPGGSVTWEFDVDEAGFYNLALSYCGIAGKNYDIVMDVLLDGEAPKSAAATSITADVSFSVPAAERYSA